ncbi:Alpha/beta hydrolase family-domain-containing protein [Suillus paluster]|uniref:Alpha/beta hydrolase family-domain-containing protein n=1 Tax=Suillus paluster TaxID=48578 RepID=UPI001B86387D|nr:Alpha/beta hydrolase family-domain-containing protein [Suillus paluster]KAG1728505.1 Alpha/beta hydrolase family-domain-containing protein [Suillus paluster]
MAPLSTPYTPTTLRATVTPCPWVPFKPHEGHIETPPLPYKPRTDKLLDVYNISTHVIPAANPRATPDAPVPEPPPRSSNRDVMKLGHEFTERQVRQAEGAWFTNEKLLWNCVNRYTKKGKEANARTKGITLFLAHATGFPKETWEATLCYLLTACGSIDEIWSLESVQHGDSALLNRQNLSGSSFDWTDNARDIANFLINYMPEDVETSTLPIQLPRLHASIGESRQKNGFSSRTVVAAGHSFGGCSLVLAALNFPALFSSMILVDAIIDLYQGPAWEFNKFVVGATLVRREQWPSREDALRSFKSSPMFSTWHPDVLRLYVDHGLYEDASGCVRLKTSPVHEALIYANPRASREAWESLERLEENIELLWVVPGKLRHFVPTAEQAAKERVWRRPANSSNILVECGHLIPHECPRELAQIMADFLHRKYGVILRQSKL